jgi:CENP-B N-terminal DNA-binding domain
MTYISRADLAKKYDICTRTLYTWVKEAKIELREGHGFTKEEYQKIVDMFGDPSVFKARKMEKAAQRARDKKKKNK